jgi:hypothetical protein
MNSLARHTSLALCTAALALTGCASHPRYITVAPPPPPVYGPSPLVQIASSNGFHDGEADGARDLLQRAQYRPEWDRRYAKTPGYAPGMGPYPIYRDAYRTAYLHGYNTGFRHAEGM